MAVLEKLVTPAAGSPAAPETGWGHPRLDISVVFTSVESTLAALRHAGAIAGNLAGRITLLVPQVVPYPLPLTSPPVLIDWNERRFRVIAEAAPVETTVRLFLCRDRDETLRDVLGRHSLVVLGGPGGWWRFTAEKRLARKLRRFGHKVVFVESE
jgi:hypothetical protein